MRITNRKAFFNYKLLERFEAGIELKGSEAKSLRIGRGDLSNSHARFSGRELFLINANIPSEDTPLDSSRTRKLLLHKSELISLKSRIEAKKLTIIPVKIYNKGRLIKVELALAKTKRSFEKKEAIKKRDLEREIEKEFKVHK